MIISVGQVERQTQELFDEVMNHYNEAITTKPHIIITDGCPRIKDALRMLKNTTHLLCVFHIWKNFYTHIRPVTRGLTNKEWHSITNEFWFFAKYSDIRMESRWCELFDDFVGRIGSLCNSTTLALKSRKNAREWLDGTLKRKKEQWAAVFTHRHTTFGANASVRIEVCNRFK